ncbi:DMT family transporter [Salinarimonas ramus]|uniref:Membrane protein n=1 Tax=Salinarimonas ramus TaxID=690164 RepID=A0A917QKZ1_9HYPH|nr:DMT family transporter [Salinarimonas ramus]GGK55445.1 membrane protein [Salinarimonas ramus]
MAISTGHAQGASARASDLATYVRLSLATLFWAGVFVAGKISLEVLDPVFLAAARFLVGAAAVGVVVVLTRRFAAAGTREIALFARIGFLGVFAYNILFTIALDLSTPLHGLVIIATTPAWTAALSLVMLRAAVRPMQLVGFACAFGAVLVVILPEARAAEWRFSSGTLLGDVLFVAAAIVWSVYTIEVKRALAAHAASTITGWSLALGALMLAPAAALLTEVPAEIAAIRPFDAAAIVYMGLLATLGAFWLWSQGVAAIGPARASVFLNLVPIWGAIMTAIAFATLPSPTILAAIGLAVTGVVLVQRAGR